MYGTTGQGLKTMIPYAIIKHFSYNKIVVSLIIIDYRLEDPPKPMLSCCIWISSFDDLSYKIACECHKISHFMSFGGLYMFHV